MTKYERLSRHKTFTLMMTIVMSIGAVLLAKDKWVWAIISGLIASLFVATFFRITALQASLYDETIMQLWKLSFDRVVARKEKGFDLNYVQSLGIFRNPHFSFSWLVMGSLNQQSFVRAEFDGGNWFILDLVAHKGRCLIVPERLMLNVSEDIQFNYSVKVGSNWVWTDSHYDAPKELTELCSESVIIYQDENRIHVIDYDGNSNKKHLTHEKRRIELLKKWCTMIAGIDVNY